MKALSLGHFFEVYCSTTHTKVKKACSDKELAKRPDIPVKRKGLALFLDLIPEDRPNKNAALILSMDGIGAATYHDIKEAVSQYRLHRALLATECPDIGLIAEEQVVQLKLPLLDPQDDLGYNAIKDLKQQLSVVYILYLTHVSNPGMAVYCGVDHSGTARWSKYEGTDTIKLFEGLNAGAAAWANHGNNRGSCVANVEHVKQRAATLRTRLFNRGYVVHIKKATRDGQHIVMPASMSGSVNSVTDRRIA